MRFTSTVVSSVALLCCLLLGCAGVRARFQSDKTDDQPATDSKQSPGWEAAKLRQELASATSANRSLNERLAASEDQRITLEERLAALEAELANTVDEVLRSKASMPGSTTRAVAISRIAEARVQIESIDRSEDPEVRARVARANDFLRRADNALGEDNFGGAAYLAERAGELVQQARIVARLRGSSTGAVSGIVPIVPHRAVITTGPSNLREGPSTRFPTLITVQIGEELTATARSGEWLQVLLRDGASAWVHQSLVE